MSQTAIPLEFERYLQNQISVGDAPDMNEMIFAHIPGLDPSQPINRENGLPDVSLWVHQQDIDQVGKLGDNALAYSVVIPSTVAEFTFNAIYLRDKNVPNSCGMVVHKAIETKENGMASTKSLVQAYDGAAQIAGITVDASTWQIDYQARLKGIEEDHRLACLDNYGHTAFVDGFDVTQQADPNKYKVTPGVVYVGGLRGVLSGEVLQTIDTKPNGLYVDVVRQGTALSVWENKVTIAVSETEITDYVDGNGDQHYVAKLAGINADGSVVDWRTKGGLAEHTAANHPHPQYLRQQGTQKTAIIGKTAINALSLQLWPVAPDECTLINTKIRPVDGVSHYIQIEGCHGEVTSPIFVKLAFIYRQRTNTFESARAIVNKRSSKPFEIKLSIINNYVVISLSATGFAPLAISGFVTNGLSAEMFTNWSASLVDKSTTSSMTIVSIDDAKADRVGEIIYSLNPNTEPDKLICKGGNASRIIDALIWEFAQKTGLVIAQHRKNAEPKKYSAWFGDGDGKTTFTLPNLHQKHFLRGAPAGIAHGTAQDDAMRRLHGNVSFRDPAHFGSATGVFKTGPYGNEHRIRVDTVKNPLAVVSFDSDRIVQSANEIRPYGVNVTIKIHRGYM